MADSDKDILITPNVSQTSQPEIKMVGKDNSPMYLKVLDDNTLSFEGVEGQAFSISPTMSTGTIFSVNDISGVPSITVDADGTITLAPYQDGNIGIGMTSPTAALHITSPDTATEAFRVDVTDTDSTADSTPFVIDGDGRVGIGTASPVAGMALTLNGDGTTYEGIAFQSGGSTKWHMTTDGSAWYHDSKVNTLNYNIRLRDSTGTYQIFHLDADTAGTLKAGIGTDSPSTELHVSGASHPSIRVTGTDNANADPAIELLGTADDFTEGGQLWYDNGTGVLHLASVYNNAAADIQFHTRTGADRSTSNVRMTIAGDGNVGIGTTSPSEALDVVGDITTSAHLNARRVNIEETSGYGSMEMGGPSGAFLDMKNPFSDDFDARLITDGNGLDIIMSGAGRDIRLMTNGTERFKVEDALVTSSVGLTVNGSITVADNIIHSGDTNNTISFGTDTQSFNTGSTSRMNISDSGLQIGTGARVTTILDEDTMSSNSATALATQQSIKAYVDSQSGGGGSPAGSDSQVQYNNGGSFGGDADFTWDDTNNRLVIGSTTSQHDGLGKLTVKGTDASFLLEKHDDSASGGPTMTLYRYSASVADNDLIGQVNFRGEGSTGNPSTYISMRAEIEDTTEGTKDGALIVRGLINNTQTNLVEIHGSGLTLNQGTFNGNIGTTTYKPSVYMDTGTQNVNQTEATLGFNSEVLDPANNASSTTDGHIRLAAGGYYRISYSIPINDDGSTGGDRTRVFTFMQVDDNNSFTSPTTVAQSRAQVYTRENSGGSGLSSSFIYQHTANDYIRLRIDAEGTTDISTESNQSQISIEYLGPA